MNLHTVFRYSVNHSQIKQQIKIQSNIFLMFDTTTYFLDSVEALSLKV